MTDDRRPMTVNQELGGTFLGRAVFSAPLLALRDIGHRTSDHEP